MKTYIKQGDNWIIGDPSSQNEEYKVIHDSGFIVKSRFCTADHLLSISEREWRDSELKRTDKFVVMPDSPEDYTSYRAFLRDYPAQSVFPNGTRPAF